MRFMGYLETLSVAAIMAKPTDALLQDQIAGQDLVFGYDDELAGHLADRMALAEIGRVPILNRRSGQLVGLVARRDLLRVRANVVQHEREREALIRLSR
jgi:chloride channel protein, CIC family